MKGRLLGALLVAAVAILTMLACNRSHSPATAEPIAKAQQWEYKVVEPKGKEERDQKPAQDFFTKMGADGWEYSGRWGSYGLWIFKRPKR